MIKDVKIKTIVAITVNSLILSSLTAFLTYVLKIFEYGFLTACLLGSINGAIAWWIFCRKSRLKYHNIIKLSGTIFAFPLASLGLTRLYMTHDLILYYWLLILSPVLFYFLNALKFPVGSFESDDIELNKKRNKMTEKKKHHNKNSSNS